MSGLATSLQQARMDAGLKREEMVRWCNRGDLDVTVGQVRAWSNGAATPNVRLIKHMLALIAEYDTEERHVLREMDERLTHEEIAGVLPFETTRKWVSAVLTKPCAISDERREAIRRLGNNLLSGEALQLSLVTFCWQVVRRLLGPPLAGAEYQRMTGIIADKMSRIDLDRDVNRVVSIARNLLGQAEPPADADAVTEDDVQNFQRHFDRIVEV